MNIGLAVADRQELGRTAVLRVTEDCVTQEFEKKSDAVGPCTRVVQVDTENHTSQTHHSLPHEPTRRDASQGGTGILAGVDFTPQDPLPGSDGKIRCALIWCPDVPQGTRFALIRTDNNGDTEKLEAGVLTEQAPSLNLAHLRRRGAQLGANEVVLILPQACASLD